MQAKASVKGHPIHTILVPLPIGLWVFALVADVAALTTNAPAWRTVADYCIGGGIVGALLAAVFGLVDLVSIEDRSARRIGIQHMILNLLAVGVFGLNFWWRFQSPEAAGPIGLTVLGVLLIGLSGWLGGELVYRHGVGVVSSGRAPEARPDKGWSSESHVPTEQDRVQQISISRGPIERHH